ncbi:MAG: amino acid dehydrogenase [Gammaproteobacteria bacterium]|nr:amino acid dehydrogenase [Gammaproteobacteria bacterium]
MTHTESHNNLFDHAAALGFGDIHFKVDRASGLRSIIAIHNTRLGPALGGCRCVPYPSTEAALHDVMNLSRAMSYKAAMAGLPLGGGKAVIMAPPKIENRKALFEAYGRFVDELGGRFISSVDSGTGVQDMDAAARHTRYVRSTSNRGDPSPSTALGVRRGIEAAVKFKLKQDALAGIHVAIQGAGHVGYYLAKELHALGARLTMCDVNPAAVERCVSEFGVSVVSPDQIYSVAADVFAPCALGGPINDETVEQLKVKIVAGAANNILADIKHAQTLQQRDILYAPDYVINAGGLMQVWIEDKSELRKKVLGIYDTLMKLFDRAANMNATPEKVADHMADEILYGH